MNKIMASIKSFTDISQSKKLAEILPLESADMCYIQDLLANCKYGDYKPYIGDLIPAYGQDKIRCWSLAALLSVLPILDNRSPVMSKTFDEKYRVVYHSTTYEKAILTSDYDNPVDAYVEMIEKLHELNLL